MMHRCPTCGTTPVLFDGSKKLTCPSCGWIYYHNVAAAVMAVLTVGEEVLFARRARAPARGRLELPGGFVDPGESAEEAIARELDEELGLCDLALAYLGSAPNTYTFAGIEYRTCDLVYAAPLGAVPAIHAPEELAELVLTRPEAVSPADIAFESVRAALALWRRAPR